VCACSKPSDVAESTQCLQEVVQRQRWRKISRTLTTLGKVAVLHLPRQQVSHSHQLSRGTLLTMWSKIYLIQSNDRWTICLFIKKLAKTYTAKFHSTKVLIISLKTNRPLCVAGLQNGTECVAWLGLNFTCSPCASCNDSCHVKYLR